MSLYTLDNEVFRGLVLYGGLSLFKMVSMSFVTAYHRVKNNAIPNPEDAGTNDPEKRKRLLEKNEDVERVRRAHLNDIENILPFGLMAMLYVATNPSPSVALWHFRVFFGARLLHTVSYLAGISKTRGLGFAGGALAFFSIAFQTIRAVL